MGGKSRKTGKISKKLIDRLKRSDPFKKEKEGNKKSAVKGGFDLNLNE